jgi:hypothetical protein
MASPYQYTDLLKQEGVVGRIRASRPAGIRFSMLRSPVLAAGLIVRVRFWFAASLLWAMLATGKGNACSWFLQRSFTGDFAANTAAS